MTARNDNDDARRDAGCDGSDGGEYDGMDALMAALVGEPVPEGARRDAGFMAAHRAAVADVALLREQLALMGDTLARGDGARMEADSGNETGARARGEGAQARGEAGDPAGPRTPAVGPADGPRAAHAAGRGAIGGAEGSEAGLRAAHAVGPGAADGPSRSPAGPRAGLAAGPGAVGGPSGSGLPGVGQGGAPRPGLEAGGSASGTGVASLSGRRGRRPLVVALRGLAAAAAATVVVGMGWLVVQSGAGTENDSSGSTAADAGARPQHGEEDAKLGHAGYLACARLVVEGTVAAVEPVPGTGQDRVTLDVERSYKPAKSQDQVVFPMAEDVDPRLRRGDHVLVGITRGQAEPDMWSVGEKEIARERAWITAALPESRTLPCQ